MNKDRAYDQQIVWLDLISNGSDVKQDLQSRTSSKTGFSRA